MTKLNILTLPDKRLKTVAEPVTVFDMELENLASDMLETMYAAPGIGLAATQVDRHIQMVVLDVSEMNDEPMVLVNPKIISKDGVQTHEEGCLSVPDIHEGVMRKPRIKIQYLDENWEQHEEWFEGIVARIMQHEYDHIEGKIFVEYLSNMRKMLLKRKLNDISTGNIDAMYKMVFPNIKKGRR